MQKACNCRTGRRCKRCYDSHLPGIDANEDDHSFRALIERVVEGEVVAWQNFVERINPYLDSLLARYSYSDEDLRSDLFVFVLEQLKRSDEQGSSHYRLRQYLDSLDMFGKQARFNAWFNVVVQNLVSDYFREKLGRRTLPTAIRRMGMTCQEIYKLLYWKQMTEGEVFESTCNQWGLSREEFDALVERINCRLSTCNRWSLVAEQTRRQRPASINALCGPDRNCCEILIPDPSPRANPQVACTKRSHRKKAMAMRMALHEAIAKLPTDSLMLLICRYKYDLTANELMRIFGTCDNKRIYVMLNCIYKHLRAVLQARGFNWEEVEHGLMSMEGFFDEIAELDTHVINADFDGEGRREMAESEEALLA